MAVIVSKGIVVPSRVNFVDYIQSSGTQKIDTGVAVKSTIGYEVEFALESASGIHGIIGGFTYGGYNHNFAAYNGQWITQYGNNGQHMFGTADTNKHTLSQNVTAGVVKLDGTTIQTGLTYYDNTDKTFALFCYNGGSSYPQFWPGSLKLYRCKMYDSGILIRDYWPCYDPDGVACLYDKVEKKYYYNQGTGEFFAYQSDAEDYYWEKSEIGYEPVYTQVADGGGMSKSSQRLMKKDLSVTMISGQPYWVGTMGSVSDYGNYPYTLQYVNSSMTEQKVMYGPLVANPSDSQSVIATYKLTLTGAKEAPGAFVAIVRSLDAAAYPENGVQNGYWYKKLG